MEGTVRHRCHHQVTNYSPHHHLHTGPVRLPTMCSSHMLALHLTPHSTPQQTPVVMLASPVSLLACHCISLRSRQQISTKNLACALQVVRPCLHAQSHLEFVKCCCCTPSLKAHPPACAWIECLMWNSHQTVSCIPMALWFTCLLSMPRAAKNHLTRCSNAHHHCWSSH